MIAVAGRPRRTTAFTSKPGRSKRSRTLVDDPMRQSLKLRIDLVRLGDRKRPAMAL